jgi:hypothetical protein
MRVPPREGKNEMDRSLLSTVLSLRVMRSPRVAAQAVLVCILLVITRSSAWALLPEYSSLRVEPVVTATTGAAHPAERSVPNSTRVIDFTDYTGGPIRAWLRTKGFRLEHGAKDPAALALSHKAGALVLEAKQPVRGLLVNDQIKLEPVSTVRITWGILKYPKGASYARQVNNEALAVYISFGEDDVASGHALIPARPYFIGLFLGQEEPRETPYQGRYFREGGRFVSVGNPPPYETVTSEFDLRTAFQTYFDKTDVPMISGVSLGVDTFASREGGTAAAYIHRIEFLD